MRLIIYIFTASLTFSNLFMASDDQKINDNFVNELKSTRKKNLLKPLLGLILGISGSLIMYRRNKNIH